MIKIVFVLILITLNGCSTKPPENQNHGDLTGQDIALTPVDEQRMLGQLLPDFQADYPALQNADIQNYFSNLGSKVARLNGLEGSPYNYSFTVVDATSINAFSLPAGAIFVTLPLIALTNTEAELVGVISHEMGHIKAHHVAERLEMIREADGRTAWYDEETSVLGRLLTQKYEFMLNSHKEELEADRLGFQIGLGANYHKEQIIPFYERLYNMEQKAKQLPALEQKKALAMLADISTTHPLSKERTKQLAMLPVESPPPSVGALVNTKQFERIRALSRQLLKQKASVKK